jgi:hypothetical protein
MPDDWRPAYHPAGHDTALRASLEEVQAGRWMAMRDLLAHTGADWALRTARSQVLGAAAARSNVVALWRAEEPGNVNALVMHARVLVEQALQAHRAEALVGASLAELERHAREACWVAGNAVPADPVPWVCLLALAQLDVRAVRPEHRLTPPGPMLPVGPWGLLRGAHERDPGNREAYHRMLQVLHARQGKTGGDAAHFVNWTVSWARSGSPLLVLPLYAQTEQYRIQGDRGRVSRGLLRQWASGRLGDVERALHGWCEVSAPARRSLLDLSHVAHGLWAAARFAEAWPVFEALGPYATRVPWDCTADAPGGGERDLLWARAQCRAAAERGRPRSPT